MTDLELENIEIELKKRWNLPYAWGRKQNDVWDKHSNFIYEIKDWDLLKERISRVSIIEKIDSQEFLNYAGNRWYNFNSAMAVEKIFKGINGIVPAQNPKNRLVDFKFFGIDFDHKTSIFPSKFKGDLKYAGQHPEKLIEWLYRNQSSQQRQHFSNRLFLVVYARDGAHWKLKAELVWLKNIIEKYSAAFEPSQLKSFVFSPGKTTYSDIIWAIK